MLAAGVNLTQTISNTIAASGCMWWLTRRQAGLLKAQLDSQSDTQNAASPFSESFFLINLMFHTHT